MKKLHIQIFLFVCLLVSCNSNDFNLPYIYNTNPRYTKGSVEFFGHEYATYQNPNNVLSVSLFSDSLSVDSTGNMKGIGQFLYLEDVFIAPSDTLLPAGTYTVDKSGLPNTVLPGKNDTIDAEIFPVGAYISYYEANGSKSIMKYITAGTFTVLREGSNYSIECNFETADKRPLKGKFYGKLPQVDESLKVRNSRLQLKHHSRKI